MCHMRWSLEWSVRVVNLQGHSNLRIFKRTDSRQVFLVFRTEEVSRMELKLAFKWRVFQLRWIEDLSYDEWNLLQHSPMWDHCQTTTQDISLAFGTTTSLGVVGKNVKKSVVFTV